MAQLFWHIHRCSLFRELSESQLGLLEQRARTRKFPKGATVYLPSDAADGTFLLAEGRIRICSTTPEGKHVISGFVEPGELFGELAIIDDGQREERAEAVVGSTVILLANDILRDLMARSPQVALGITKLIGLRRKRVERRLRSLLFRSNRDRLVHLLLELLDQYGKSTNEGIEIGLRLSHQELASIIGATRETVTTLLGEMQQQGWLKIQRQRLVVLNRQQLETAGSLIPSSIREGGSHRKSVKIEEQSVTCQIPDKPKHL
jgi:CRP-like cAMP-binding protein